MPVRPPPVVLTLVPPVRAARIAAVLSPAYAVVPLGRWDAARPRGAGSPAAAVVDPMLLPGAAGDAAPSLHRLAEWLSVVFYTSLTPEAMHHVFELRGVRGAMLILEGLEDGPDALRRTLAMASASTHRLRVLQHVRAEAGPLPSMVDAALSRLLAAPGELSVRRLAELASVSRRTLERRLAEAGGRSPRWLVRTARAQLARELLCGSDQTVEAVTHLVGYAKLESLRALTRWSFGTSPSSIRRGATRRP